MCSSDLFGNLAQRVLSMIAKNLNGLLPTDPEKNWADLKVLERVLIACGEDVPNSFEILDFSGGIDRWMQATFACNKYIDEQAPWTLRKTDHDRMSVVLANLYECIAHLAIAILPVIPESAGKLLDQMGIPLENRTYDGLHGGAWYKTLNSGDFTLAAPTPLFPRLELSAEAAI